MLLRAMRGCRRYSSHGFPVLASSVVNHRRSDSKSCIGVCGVPRSSRSEGFTGDFLPGSDTVAQSSALTGSLAQRQSCRFLCLLFDAPCSCGIIYLAQRIRPVTGNVIVRSGHSCSTSDSCHTDWLSRRPTEPSVGQRSSTRSTDCHTEELRRRLRNRTPAFFVLVGSPAVRRIGAGLPHRAGSATD